MTSNLLLSSNFEVLETTGLFENFQGLSPEMAKYTLSEILGIPTFAFQHSLKPSDLQRPDFQTWGAFPKGNRRYVKKVVLKGMMRNGEILRQCIATGNLQETQRQGTRFVMLSTPRSGSTHLQWLLNQHAGVICQPELFDENPAFAAVPGYFANYRRCSFYRRSEFAVAKSRSLNGYLRTFKADLPLGFKLMASHYINYPALHSFLGDKDVAVISIRRKNILKQFVSVLVAEKTGVWHSNEGMPQYEPVELDATTFMDELRAFAAEVAVQDKLAHDTGALNIYYEDLISDPKRIMDAIFNHLGVATMPVPAAHFRKILPNRLQDTVKNYNGIVGLLKGTAFENFIEG